MARPKAGDGPSAKERIGQAFWDLLEEMPYQEITLGNLCKRAHVNHNTFYYHYKSIDDLAHITIEQYAEDAVDIVKTLPYLFYQNAAPSPFELFSQAQLLPKLSKVRILLSPHGVNWMKEEIAQIIFSMWLNVFQIHQSDLSDEDNALLHFYLGGILTLLGSATDTELEAFMRSEKARRHMQILLETLEELAGSPQTA